MEKQWQTNCNVLDGSPVWARYRNEYYNYSYRKEPYYCSYWVYWCSVTKAWYTTLGVKIEPEEFYY